MTQTNYANVDPWILDIAGIEHPGETSESDSFGCITTWPGAIAYRVGRLMRVMRPGRPSNLRLSEMDHWYTEGRWG